jgi:hypothetical protein
MTIATLRASGVKLRTVDHVVIAAAVRYLYGSAAVIRSIRPVPARGPEAWTREGRLAAGQHGLSLNRAGRNL